MNDLIYLAADTATFWDQSALGKTIAALLVVVGILVVLAALFKAVPKLIGGKIGDGVKYILGGIVVAAFCFDPTLLFDIVGKIGDLIGQGTDSFDTVTNTGGTTGGSGRG